MACRGRNARIDAVVIVAVTVIVSIIVRGRRVKVLARNRLEGARFHGGGGRCTGVARGG